MTFKVLAMEADSPAPNKKRAMTSEIRLKAAPVAAVKTDHNVTVHIHTFFGPHLSEAKPLKIENGTKPQKKALRTIPHWSL